MDENTRGHIFEPFFPVVKKAPTNAGLELAIVHSIVTKAHGSIDVTSEPDRGTTFDMLFPAAAASQTIHEF